MHNLDTLVADISALLKKSGDSGDTGDRQTKHLNNKDYSVTTRAQQMSPLANRVVTAQNLSGDGKYDSKQSLREGVTTVTTVTTHLRQGRAPTLAPGNVAEWYAILDKLTALDPPEWTSPVRWQNMIFDAEAFLSRWSGAADQLGWKDLDLFGVHPVAPADRYDLIGLLLVIQGGEVVALTPEAATIRRPSKSILTYHRHDTAGAVLLSEIT